MMITPWMTFFTYGSTPIRVSQLASSVYIKTPTKADNAPPLPPASEPPQVDYTIAAVGDEVKLDLAIAFSCQAEKIIFELSLRNLL